MVIPSYAAAPTVIEEFVAPTYYGGTQIVETVAPAYMVETDLVAPTYMVETLAPTTVVEYAQGEYIEAGMPMETVMVAPTMVAPTVMTEMITAPTVVETVYA